MHGIGHTDMAGRNTTLMLKESMITSDIRIIDFDSSYQFNKDDDRSIKEGWSPIRHSLACYFVYLPPTTGRTGLAMSGLEKL